MTHPKTIFVSDDARLRDGKLDPTDEEIIRQAGGKGKVFHMNSEEAIAYAGAGGPLGPVSPVEREVGRFASERDEPPGLRRLTEQDVHDLVGAAAETWQLFRREAREAMTEERAAYVRKLRVERKYTWRSVARACSNAWRKDWGSNQIAGMSICEAAAEYTFEDYRKPPWN
jgi:hypothetical protein